MNQKLEIPDHPVMMQTNRDFRLSSLNGWVVNFKADKPERGPPHVYVEAIGVGAVVCEEQPPEPEKVPAKEAHPSIAEAAKLEAEAKYSYIEQACLKLMARNDNTAFKADGYPKAISLIAELPPEAPRPTAQEIAMVFDDMRTKMELAED
jgi:hypothetical protein